MKKHFTSGRIVIYILVCACLLVVIQQMKIWDKLGFVPTPEFSKAPSELHKVQRLPYGTYKQTDEGMLVYTEDPQGNMEDISSGRMSSSSVPVDNRSVYYDPLTQTYRSKEGDIEGMPSN